MTFPYQPVQIRWMFKGLFHDTIMNNPTFDSSWVVNGKTLYRYTLNRPYIISTIGTYPISLIANNQTADGCSGEQEINYDLQIYERPTAAFSTSQTGCLNDPVAFFDSTNGNGRDVIRWSWNFGDGAVSGLKNPVHPYGTAGTYTVSFSSITDIGCLSDTATKTLLFTDQPVAAFTSDAAACATKPIQFKDHSTPAGANLKKWKWIFGDGDSSVEKDPLHAYLATGTYTIALTVETITGCKSTVTRSVQVNGLPIVNFAIPEVCLTDAFAEFIDSSSIADNSGNQLTYLWNFGDPGAGAQNPNTSAVKDALHKYNAVGTYPVKLTVTSKDGCSGDTTKAISVNGANPKADFVILNAEKLCSDSNVIIADRSTVDFGNITRVEIYWDYNNDPTSKTLDENPVYGKSYAHQYAAFSSPSTKNASLTYIAYSGKGCISQKTIAIVLLADPHVVFDSIASLCQDVTAFQVKTPVETSGTNGTGAFSGNAISSTGVFNAHAAGPGVHTIRYNFLATNGCTTRQEQNITVNPTPLADAGPDRTVLEGGSIAIAANASPNCLYQWTPAGSIEDSKVITPKVFPTTDTRYQFTVTSAAGCASTDEVLVTVLKEVKVPNAFSPNGDGINDTWSIPNLVSYPGAVVEVYNRYGQLVFSSVGYYKEWNGRLNGALLPMGTYYWIIDPKNGRPRMSGSVTLIL